jgi:hypothetical protein
MKVDILRQFDQCLLALDRGHRHFRLECRAVISAWSSCHDLFLARSILLLLRGKCTYPGWSGFQNNLSYEWLRFARRSWRQWRQECSGCWRQSWSWNSSQTCFGDGEVGSNTKKIFGV